MENMNRKAREQSEYSEVVVQH